MSFLGDLVNTIGGDKAPAPPIRPSSRPASTNAPLSLLSKSAPSTPSGAPNAKPVYKGTAGITSSQQGGGLKRKAEDISTERPVKLQKPLLQTNSDNGQKTTKPNGSETRSPITSKPPSNGLPSSIAPQTTAKPLAKPAPRGSYADLLARAKEAQQTKTPSQIGMIHHKATDKVKPSKLNEKLAERKKEDQDKSKPGLPLSKAGTTGKSESRYRIGSPVKKVEKDIPKQPKKPQPPLHGPAVYKGTMGQAAKRPVDEIRRKKPSRNDDYLGTDEEDEGDYGYDDEDEDDYGSDASDAMEGGGFDELEEEERMAEKIARDEDARELALEQRLKKEKLERKQKLAALAKKHK
ncbi:hypothetical protein LTS08_000226 [Lithohypha guttulata]|nr:hypothetical protein LTS08_000226 [Lithohypha guttulata]